MAQEPTVVELQFLDPLILPETVAESTVDDVRNALERGSVVNQRNEYDQTSLHIACELGKEDVTSLLLSHNANISLKDFEGMTPLLAASRGGSLPCVRQLLDAGVDIHQMDNMDWTALMWASYKGHTEIVQALIGKGANVNDSVAYNMTPLLWAAGRGHLRITKLLLAKGAKVNATDKFGSTPLIWASRRGYYEIITTLLEYNADINAVGAGGANALITAIKNGYEEIVRVIVQKGGAHVNHTDENSSSALTYAAKLGKHDAILLLLNAGAYLNLANKSGQTPLIKAVKNGHLNAVRVLLSRYADIDIRGKDNSTALHVACEKGHIAIVKELLSCDPDLEAVNESGDTPLLLTVKCKNLTIARMLIDKGASVSATDKKKDSPLHIAIRARSLRIASLLLRKPQDARMLYQPNKDGETPYNLDSSHNKSILSSIFGAKNMTFECDVRDMAGPAVPGNYDLYSSALADILCEPTLTPPLTVGLYAKWGSGKSLLLRRLERQMLLFTSANRLQPLQNPGFISFLLVMYFSVFLGLFTAAFAPQPMKVLLGIFISTILFSAYCITLGLVFIGDSVGHWGWAKRMWKAWQKHFAYISLLFKLWFMVPPLPKQMEKDKAVPVRFLFTNYNRLTSVGGQTSLAEMIGLLSRSAEKHLGFLAVRLYRPFHDDMAEQGHEARFRRICCLPTFAYVIIFMISLSAIIILTVVEYGPNPGLPQAIFNDTAFEESAMDSINVAIMLLGLLDVVIFLIGISTIYVMCNALMWSQRKRALKAAHHTKSQERLIQQLKYEVDLLCQTVIAIDAFNNTQTRLCVTINGLDSCEQDKILQALDTIHVLFSQRPYITILSIDPVIISKAIHGSLNSAFRDANITGHDYLKNVIHLPFFLREKTRKLKNFGNSNDVENQSDDDYGKDDVDGPKKLPSKTLPVNRRVPGPRRSTKVTDLGKLMFTEDWFNSMSPQLMKRVLHIVTFTGRLLRAENTDFTWSKLAAWINLTEQWPYRISFILYLLENFDGKISLKESLRSVYERNYHLLNPNDPKLVIDSSDDLAFRAFLSARCVTVCDVCDLLPATVNLDPKLFDPISIYGNSPLPANSIPNGDIPNSVASDADSTEDLVSPVIMQVPNSKLLNSNHVNGNSHVQELLVEDIANRIFEIRGLSPENVEKYVDFVKLNNLNGAAILACDLDDLKKELFAPFGDWCLLKQWIQRLKIAGSHNDSGLGIILPESRHVKFEGSRSSSPRTCSGEK